MEYVSQEYWNESYKRFEYFLADDQVTEFIDKFITTCNESERKTCFEIGCFPGRYLCYVGKKNYIVNGIDMTPRVEEDFINWLSFEDVQVGEIIRGDCLKYLDRNEEKFDLVYSIGFIEHFKEYKEIIGMHDKILKEDGLLMITTPNFRGGVQRILHSILDKKNLKRHNLKSMNPDEWKKVLEEKGYTVLYAGYFGAFDFWVDEEHRGKLRRGVLKIVNYINHILKDKKIPDSNIYSPYCGIVAQKNKGREVR